MKDLNEMPVDFAREIVRLWREFVGELQKQRSPLAALAQTKLDDAIASAAQVIANGISRGYSVSPIPW
jgi:hypothetical protein